MRRVLCSTIALFALLFASCELLPGTEQGEKTPQVDDSPKFHVTSETYMVLPAEGGNAEIEFVIDTEVEGAVVTATSVAEWITDITTDNTIKFFVEANTDITERLGSITIRYANTTAVVAVEQSGRAVNGDARLTVDSERTLEFNSMGGNGTIPYTLTGADEGDKPAVDSNQAWIKITTIDSDKVNFTVEQNTTTSIRRGNISLSYGANKITIQIKQEAASNLPILSADKASVRLGESITFTVTLANTDVTASSTIYDYYTKTEVSNPYTPAEVAERVFYATYNGNKSDVFTVNVVPSDTPALPADSAPQSYDFNQRILLIDHTGTGCSYCPAAKEAFKAAEENANYKDKFNTVYSYSFDGSGGACYSAASKTLWNYFVQVCKSGDQLTGYPSFTTNYCYNYTGKYNITDRVDAFWDENVSASIALATKRNGNKLVVNAAIKSSKSQSFKLSLWLLEDDIYATQSGATASWMHTHHNVMRDAITGITTSDIAGIEYGYVTANTTYERVMEFDLFVGSSWNINNCKIIAIISAPNSDYNGKYEVVNTTICELNGSVGFDYKK